MKINPKIYKINKGHRLLQSHQSMGKICRSIIKISNLKFDSNYVVPESDCVEYFDENTEIYFFLYHYKTSDESSEWVNFLPSLFTKGANFNQEKLSLILFLEFQNHLYCVIGGSAFRIVQPFLEEQFGINIYSRILDPENDELLSIRTRNITGKIAASSNHYKNNFKLIDHIKFGTVPTDISVKLGSTVEEYFRLVKTRNDNVHIQVSNSVKFRKLIEFDDLKEIVKELKYIEELEKKDYLNTYERIQDNNYIENTLKEHLVKKIYNDISNVVQATIQPLDKFHFEFCHPSKLEQFYEADFFQVTELEDKSHKVFAKVDDRNRIYDVVIKYAVDKFGTNISQDELKYFLYGVRVRSYKNGDKKSLCTAMFLQHINSEFEIDKRPVFLLDNNWYILQDSFLLDLNRNCERILKNYKVAVNILPKKWNLSVQNTEAKYNNLYKDLKNYLVFDTIAIQGIELCAIIKYDDRNLYLIHVKRGFDSSMRELYNQIILSARRLEESKSSKEKDYLRRSYESLSKKQRNNDINTFEDFVSLFDRNIKYVMAFSNNNSNNLVEDNLKIVKSSIAKFSVIQASSEMRSNYYELLFAQIEHF